MPTIPHKYFRKIRFGTFVFFLFVVLGACEPPSVHTPSLQDVRGEGAPIRESWEVTYNVSETTAGSGESRPRLQIMADYMATYEQGDSTFTLMRGYNDSLHHHVTAFLFDTEGDTAATVEALRLIYFDEEHRFNASGNVVVVTKEGKRLESEDLFWDDKERKIRTPGFTRITTPTETLQGFQLEADEDLDTYSLARISGQVMVEEE